MVDILVFLCNLELMDKKMYFVEEDSTLYTEPIQEILECLSLITKSADDIIIDRIALEDKGRTIINLFTVIRASFDLDEDYLKFWTVSQRVISTLTASENPEVVALLL